MLAFLLSLAIAQDSPCNKFEQHWCPGCELSEGNECLFWACYVTGSNELREAKSNMETFFKNNNNTCCPKHEFYDPNSNTCSRPKFENLLQLDLVINTLAKAENNPPKFFYYSWDNRTVSWGNETDSIKKTLGKSERWGIKDTFSWDDPFVFSSSERGLQLCADFQAYSQQHNAMLARYEPSK